MARQASVKPPETMGEPASPQRLSALARNIAEWFLENPRQLPWREDYHPYGVWVSEIMLQQTQVGTVTPYFQRFLGRFPDVHALAAAGEDEVLALWSGLGYYSRARNLRKAAHVIVAEHEGQLPRDVDTLMTLPGIGRYTAGAIASIAYNKPAPLVDGNVERVLARFFGIHAPVSATGTKKMLWDMAGRLVTYASPRDVNQGLMELGALVCTPRGPRCTTCPLRRSCAARQSGEPERLPVMEKRAPVESEEEAFLLCIRNGALLLLKRGTGVRYAGMWEPPRASGKAARRDVVRRVFEKQHDLHVDVGEHLGETTYGIMNKKVRARFYSAELRNGLPKFTSYVEHRWVPLQQVEDYALPAPVRRFLRTQIRRWESGP